MKTYSVLDLATILQLDEPVKEDLRKNFDSYSNDLKYEIKQILWDGLHELKEKMAKIKYEELMLEVDEGKRDLTTDLYDQALKRVWQDFDDVLSGKKKDVEKMEEIRAKLQPLTQDKTVSSPASPIGGSPQKS